MRKHVILTAEAQSGRSRNQSRPDAGPHSMRSERPKAQWGQMQDNRAPRRGILHVCHQSDASGAPKCQIVRPAVIGK
jgi:hypothetical protein